MIINAETCGSAMFSESDSYPDKIKRETETLRNHDFTQEFESLKRTTLGVI